MQLSELEKLYELKEKGAITQQEYDQQKSILLNNNTPNETLKIIPFSEAYISYWRKYFVWNERSTRAEYWWPFLANFLIALLLSILDFLSPFGKIFLTLFQLATFIPGISVLVRRIHDVGYSTVVALSPLIIATCLAILATIFSTINYMTNDVSSLLSSIKTIIFIFGGFSLVISSITVLVFCFFSGSPQTNKYGKPKY